MARPKGRYKSNAKGAMETILSKQIKPFLDEMADEAVREFRSVVPIREGELARSVNWVTGKKNPMARYLTALFYWRFLNDGTVKLQPMHFVDGVKMHTQRVMAEILKRFSI